MAGLLTFNTERENVPCHFTKIIKSFTKLLSVKQLPHYICNDVIDNDTSPDSPQNDIAAVMPITPKNEVYGGASAGKSS